MQYQSEAAFAAGWLIDLEFILWKRVLERDRAPDEVANVLAWLAEEAGGWWRWGEDAKDEKELVPLDQWKQIFEASQRQKRL